MKAFSRSALNASRVQALLRIVVGIIFLEHGLAKLIDFPHVETLKQTFSIFGPFSEAFRLAAGIIETTGGMLLIIGFFTSSNGIRAQRLGGGRLFRRSRTQESISDPERWRCRRIEFATHRFSLLLVVLVRGPRTIL
jgi:hypothetical protein